MITKQIKDVIKELITGIDVYIDEAPLSAEYPYAVIELERINADTVSRHQLEVNVWDKYKTYSRVDKYADDIESCLDREKYINAAFSFVIHKDSLRGHIVDEDKEIKRVRTLFVVDIA